MQHLKFNRKTKRKLIWSAAILLSGYLSLVVLPFIPHKVLSEETKSANPVPDFEKGRDIGEQVAYVNDNEKALLYRFKMMEEAKEEIILSTFDFNTDTAGLDMISALLHAAERGVKVRIIVDGGSGFLDLRGNRYFEALSANENVTIKEYNPIRLTKPWKLQARLHDKYFIIDDRMFLLGGRNTMELFLGNTAEVQNIDRELFVLEPDAETHPALDEVKEYFESVWALPDSLLYGEKVSPSNKLTETVGELRARYEDIITSRYRDKLAAFDLYEDLMPTEGIHLLHNPIEAENKEPLLWENLHSILRGGNKVTVYSPYVICGKEMYRDIAETCGSVEQLSLIINDPLSGANPFGCTDYMNQKNKLLKTGIHIYEFIGRHSLHTKAALVDEDLVLLGSFNWDMRSVYQDTELLLAVKSKELSAAIRAEAESDKLQSKELLADGSYRYGENFREAEVPFAKKLLYAFMRVLIIPIRRFL